MKIFTTPEIDSKIEDYCIANKIRKDFQWHYKYVVSNIYIRPYTDRSITEDDYVTINMELLRSLVSARQSEIIIKTLLDLTIIETDNKVVRGFKSKGYKIVNRDSFKWQLSTITDKKLSNKLADKKDKLIQDSNLRGDGYRIVNYWLPEVQFDYTKAKKFIDNHNKKDSRSYKWNFAVINLLKNKQFYSTVDDKGNRLHNNITILPTELRKFVKIDGKELYQSDIANSQPVFLYVSLSERAGIDKEELNKYRDIVCSGKFYEFMADKAGLNNDLTDYKTRKKFKQKIFGGCLFDKNYSKLSKYELLFQSEFPTIFTAIRDIKKKDYNAMAIMLQKAESKFIFSTVERIDKEIGRGKAPLLTVHDSIVSDKDNIDIVEQIMLEQFKSLYNIEPKLSVTKF